MDLCSYFEPISREGICLDGVDFDASLASAVDSYFADGPFPDLKNVNLAIVGVPEDRNAVLNRGCAAAPDKVRNYLYRLARPAEGMAVADLGNIAPGKSPEDSLFAVTEVLYRLMDRNIAVVVLGGSQDITFAQYRAYEILGRVVNIVAVDSRFDICPSPAPDSRSYLYHIVRQQPNYLFNFTNIGCQSYFCGSKLSALMDELEFDHYRLGAVQADMERTEPLIRAADLVSVDLGAVRQSDAPANGDPSPHGFYGEELCRMARFAGMSDKLSSIGFYELNPLFDRQGQTAHLTAHAVWFFIEGFYNRKSDFPYRDRENYKRFMVPLDRENLEIVFYKSKKSDRWWMEVPCETDERKERYLRHLLIPCTYDEYRQAMENEIPDLWWRFYRRVNS